MSLYHIEIHTYRRPLVWLLSKATPSDQIARWQTLLSKCDFNITYLPGKENPVADFLSRMRKIDVIELEDSRDKVIVVGAITKLKEELKPLEWSIEEIKRLQNTDKGYKIIKEMMKTGAETEAIVEKL